MYWFLAGFSIFTGREISLHTTRALLTEGVRLRRRQLEQLV